MNNQLPDIILFIVIIAVFVSAFLIIASYIFSRFIFNGYLKKNHRGKWEEMVYDDTYKGLSLNSFDKTPSLFKFRYESDEDFGDDKIRNLRKLSNGLFKAGVSIFMIIVLGSILIAIVVVVAKYLLGYPVDFQDPFNG